MPGVPLLDNKRKMFLFSMSLFNGKNVWMTTNNQMSQIRVAGNFS